MHRIGRDGFMSLIDEVVIRNIKESDSYFLFSFGEIDVRGHIGKQILNGRNKDEVISGLVDGYMNSISQLEYDKIMIYNVLPPPPYISDMVFNKSYPMVGTREEVLGYNMDINHLIQESCDKMGLIFVDIRKHIVSDDGFLDVNKSDGGIHINPKYCHILESAVNV